VCDSKARQLTNEQRTSVAEFFALSKTGGGGEGGAKARIRCRRMSCHASG
jgi:hypothetical protein